MRTTSPTSVVVVVPARNEADTLPACLASLRRARACAEVPTRIVVVLDDSTDASASIAGVEDVVAVRCRNVGAARAAGFEFAGATDPDALLLCTDADSEVEPDWVQRHVMHARAGARVVCGTVRVRDWSRLGERTRARYESSYRSRHGHGHGHVHGANLGFRARDYWRVGGFAALVTGEDVDLVERMQRVEIPVTWADDLAVETSARLLGRAPHGFAEHLRMLHATPGVRPGSAVDSW